MGLFAQKYPCMFQALHIGGLDIPEGAPCTITVDKVSNTLTINADAASIELDISRIQHLTTETDIDVEKYQDSSLMSGVVGAALFGTSGAVIGSRPKQKTKETRTHGIKIYYLLQNGEGISVLFKDKASEANRGVLGLRLALHPLVSEAPASYPQRKKIKL